MNFNPGGDDAILCGCRCEVVRNRNGLGELLGDGESRRFVIAEHCPVHNARTAAYRARRLEQLEQQLLDRVAGARSVA
jgi:hypothetical protein